MKKKSAIAMIISLIILIHIGITVSASALLQEIKVYLNKEVKITLNGGPWQAKNGNTILDPITYNGSTYLPVRAIAEALDVPIRYDPITKTVHIGENSEGVPILSEPYTKISAIVSEDEVIRKILNVDYGTVVLFSKVLNSNSRFQMEPAAQYSKLVLKLGIEGADTQLRIVNGMDSTVIKSVLLTESMGIQEITADISGVQRVVLELMADKPNTSSAVRIIAKDSYYQ